MILSKIQYTGNQTVNAFEYNRVFFCEDFLLFLFNRNLVPTFLSTIYAHDPDASLLNFDSKTLTFANPLSVFYLDSPSKDLVDQVVQGAKKLTAEQVPQFVGLAATILKKYKTRQTDVKYASLVYRFLKIHIKHLISNFYF